MTLTAQSTVLINLLFVFSVASGSTIQWSMKAPMPTGRDAMGIGVVDGKIYAISGRQGRNEREVEVYDPNSDSWNVLPDIPSEIFWPFERAIRNSGTAVVDDSIYLFSLETSDFLVFTPSQNIWRRKHSPITPRYGDYITCATANNKIYVFGGVDSDYRPIEDVWSYDPSVDSWTKLPSVFPNPREIPVIAIWQNNIYAIGGSSIISDGEDELESHVRTVDLYDPNNDSWTVVTDIPGVIIDGGAAVVENKIYVLGNCSYEYDIASDSWSEITKVPQEQTNDIGVATVGNKIFIIGGFDDGNPVDKQMVQEGWVCSMSPQPMVFIDGNNLSIAHLFVGDRYNFGISLLAGDYVNQKVDLWIMKRVLGDEEPYWFTSYLDWIKSETPFAYYSGNLHDIPYKDLYTDRAATGRDVPHGYGLPW